MTDSDKTLSIANSTFDTAISGWKLNYTTYSAADTSSLIEWDKNVDHTGNSGGSARIYNARQSTGSMRFLTTSLLPAVRFMICRYG